MLVWTPQGLTSMSCGMLSVSALQLRLSLSRGWRPLCRSSFGGGKRREVVHARAAIPDQLPFLGKWRLYSASQLSADQATALECSQGTFFSEIGADRAAGYRRDPAWLADAFAQRDTRIIPLSENKNLVKDGRAVCLPAPTMQGIDHKDPIFLGLSTAKGVPIFAVDLKGTHSTDAIQRVVDDGAEWVDVRRYGSQLQASEAGLLAYARGMVEWHFRNRYCGHCGSKIEVQEGGHSLKCSSGNCGKLSYPRMDPAVIMLITSGNYVLLGRQARWEPGRYSLLAGFLEIGESFEKAVIREVKEETGVDIDVCTLRYVASQPWPFPSSVMVGFMGEAKRRQIEPCSATALSHLKVVSVGKDRVPDVDEVNSLPSPYADGKELEDARWVHRSFLRAVLNGNILPHGQTFNVPGKYSISGYLLQRWAAEEAAPDWVGRHIQTVDIDEGNFKYVLMLLKDLEGNQKLLVRGKATLNYHSEILESTQKEVEDLGVQVEQLGGGRIEHDPVQRRLRVYSSSQAFGLANHTVTSALLQQSFPLHTVTVSWDA